MKLSFSTLGCPAWPVEDVADNARRMGFQGVEIRGIAGELDIRRLPAFSAGGISRTRALFEDAGVEIVSVDSSASFSHVGEAKLESAMKEARDHIRLAADLQAPLVRVFGGQIPQGVPFADGARRLAGRLAELGEFADGKDVTVALETHDSFLTGRAVADVMSLVGHPSVAVVWDISNCFRTGEPLAETARLLGPYVRLVHLKDSVTRDGEARLVFIGEGDVPIKEAVGLLAGAGYEGYLSYEWEKVWQPDLPEPEIAFPQYAAKMREYVRQLSRNKSAAVESQTPNPKSQ